MAALWLVLTFQTPDIIIIWTSLKRACFVCFVVWPTPKIENFWHL